jgi:hypothetical protein
VFNLNPRLTLAPSLASFDAVMIRLSSKSVAWRRCAQAGRPESCSCVGHLPERSISTLILQFPWPTISMHRAQAASAHVRVNTTHKSNSRAIGSQQTCGIPDSSKEPPTSMLVTGNSIKSQEIRISKIFVTYTTTLQIQRSR